MMVLLVNVPSIENRCSIHIYIDEKKTVML